MKLKTLKLIRDEMARDVFPELSRVPVFARRWRYAYGQYSDAGIMEFNPRNISGFEMARAVVFHELVHQYQHEILGEEPNHGESFKRFRLVAQVMGIPFGKYLTED